MCKLTLDILFFFYKHCRGALFSINAASCNPCVLVSASDLFSQFFTILYRFPYLPSTYRKLKITHRKLEVSLNDRQTLFHYFHPFSPSLCSNNSPFYLTKHKKAVSERSKKAGSITYRSVRFEADLARVISFSRWWGLQQVQNGRRKTSARAFSIKRSADSGQGINGRGFPRILGNVTLTFSNPVKTVSGNDAIEHFALLPFGCNVFRKQCNAAVYSCTRYKLRVEFNLRFY